MKSSLAARLVVLVAMMAPYATVLAQESQTLTQVLSGRPYALAIKPSDLTNEYRAVRISVAGASADPLASLSPYLAMGMSSQGSELAEFGAIFDRSWTKGDVVLVEGQRFLVTYKLDLSILDFAEKNGRGEFRRLPDASKVSLKLVLVKVEGIQTIESSPTLKGEDLVRILGAGAAITPIQANAKGQALSNLKQVALGMMMYCADSDDVLPYVQGTKAAQYVTFPYMKSIKLWESKNPNGGELRFNVALGGVSVTAIEDPSAVPLLFDSKAWPDGTRLVAFADGHVKSVDETTWKSLQKWLSRRYKASGRPLPLSYGKDWTLREKQ
jgi:hypothetical protein